MCGSPAHAGRTLPCMPRAVSAKVGEFTESTEPSEQGQAWHLASGAPQKGAPQKPSTWPPLYLPPHLPQVISQKEGDFFFDSLRQVSDWVKKSKPQKEGGRCLWGRVGKEGGCIWNEGAGWGDCAFLG